MASNPAAVAIHEARAVYPGVSECSGCMHLSLRTFDLAYYSLLATNRYHWNYLFLLEREVKFIYMTLVVLTLLEFYFQYLPITS